MRSLFILLLIINLCYLIWGVAFSDKSDISATALEIQSEHSLKLLSELEDKNHAKQESQQVAKLEINKQNKSKPEKSNLGKKLSPSIGPANTCYSLGPILDEKDSKKLQQALKDNGFEPKHKAITDKEPKSYWVYFPPHKNLEAARAVVSQLQDSNIDDYHIVRKGKFNNAISLGLYNGFSRAKIRVKDLKKRGFNPKVQTRYQEITRHWLDFKEDDSKRLKTSVWDKVQEDNPLQKLARPCTAARTKSKQKNS